MARFIELPTHPHMKGVPTAHASGGARAGFWMVFASVAALSVSLLGGAVPAVAGPVTSTVAVWGSNDHGQTSLPVGLSGVTAISAGQLHSLALKADGTVVAWGYDAYGQSSVPSALEHVTAIAAGGNHSLALKADGTVVAWGYDEYGQSSVPSTLDHVTAIAAGGNHSLALQDDGRVVAWGDWRYGQTRVPEGLADVKAIAAGYSHSLALKTDGAVVAWGNNVYQQSSVPDDLAVARVSAIAAGNFHSLALKSDGSVAAWGDNYYGEASVPPDLNDVTSIAAGGNHGMALKGDGSIAIWGRNYSNESLDTPAGLSAVAAIAVGYDHAVALIGGLAFDETPPTVQIDTPKQGATFLLHQEVNAGYACTDDASGISHCTGTVPSGTSLDTASIGAKALTVEATDSVGNHSTLAVTYRVVYGFTGFTAPIDPGTNLANAGRTVPFKFTVSDASGVPITDITALTALVVAHSCDSSLAADTIEEYAQGNSGLQNLGYGRYQFNFATLKSWAGNCRTLGLDLGDGIAHTATFKFKA